MAAMAMLAAPALASQSQASGIFTFPESISTVAKATDDFNNWVMNPIILAIVVFVTALLAYACIRFRKSANPTPAKFSHNTLIEVIWTGIPVLILVVIAVPSFALLYLQDRVPEKFDVTVKVIGYQWNWGYAYDDLEIAEYKSNMLDEKKLPGIIREELRERYPSFDRALIDEQLEQTFERDFPTLDDQRARVLEVYGNAPDTYRLAVDNPVVVPVGATVRVQVTAYDVIHNWAMPSFAIKTDAIPGRTNETWFDSSPGDEGTYYGQCSELCGSKHAFMPIQVELVPQDVFDAWAAMAGEFGGDSPEARQVILDYKGVSASGRRVAELDAGPSASEDL